MENLLSLFILFTEPGFPSIGGSALHSDFPDIPGAQAPVRAESAESLRRELQPGRVLVWRHGAAVPVEAWPDIFRFLSEGGALLHLGGEPFTHPVTGPPGHRTVQPRTVSMLKALRLNQSRRIAVGGATMRAVGPLESIIAHRRLQPETWVDALEPRLTDSRIYPDEDGSPGSRDASVTPLMQVFERPSPTTAPVGDDRFARATSALAIDHYRHFAAGGRWVLWLASTPPTNSELAALAVEAARPVVNLRVTPTRACYHDDETPAILLRLESTAEKPPRALAFSMHVTGPEGQRETHMDISLGGAAGIERSIELRRLKPVPGLYRVVVRRAGAPDTTTGFWLFDCRLFESGGMLSLDGYTLRRNGRPEPVIGTTVMSSTVHRDFLFEPNAADWDDTFRELASLQINLARTGVWSGWKRISPVPGEVDERWLRALEAYYLTARRHGIAVMFTFFSFLPEAWGGENPYLDPRSVAAQQAYVSAVARRFAPAREILWDLINEPSFSSPRHLWSCRPNGDASERRAFRDWLSWRFTNPSEADLTPWSGLVTQGAAAASQRAASAPMPTTLPAAPGTSDWQTAVRNRWRLRPDEPIDLPGMEDFSDRTVFEGRRPYRAADYVHFAQDAFADWARRMGAAIREAGSTAAITVGQDEGGLAQRPGPLFHHDAVDLTSIHTWWFNDALTWDGLMARAAGKPLLVSETGVMNRELLSGEALRGAQDSAALLSRKIGHAFAAGAFGVVQWCYDVNPYMASDNEAAIGLRRVDGSYKPEHRVLREFAAFFARNRESFDAPSEPEVVLIVPAAEMFSPRDWATSATRRAADVLVRDLDVAIRLVPDARAGRDLGRPRAIILPACRGIGETAWRSIESIVRDGGTLICTGWFETDDAGLPARRLGCDRRPLHLFEPIEADAAAETTVRFGLSATESWFAATGRPRAVRLAQGGGRLWHHPVPLEWSDNAATLARYYRAALGDAGVACRGPDERAPPAGVLVRRIPFRNHVLQVAVNESSAPATIPIIPEAAELHVPAGVARMAIYDSRAGRIVDRSHPEEAPGPR